MSYSKTIFAEYTTMCFLINRFAHTEPLGCGDFSTGYMERKKKKQGTHNTHHGVLH